MVIFCIEALIALYVRDNFIRPYVGDILVVVLVYSFVRMFHPCGWNNNGNEEKRIKRIKETILFLTFFSKLIFLKY